MNQMILKLFWSCLVPMAFFSGISYGSEDCLGPDQATSAWFYLHGMDEPTVGDHEQRNRHLLSKIASEMNLRIAIPRGNQLCDKKACWNHQGVKQVVASIDDAIEKSRECLGKRPVVGMIGFSNGGYLLNKYFQSCHHENYISYLVIGALGELSAKEQRPIKQQESCGQLTLGIGDKDQLHRRVKSLHQSLQKKFPQRTTLQIFEGGHDLDEKTLRHWFEASKQRHLKLQK